MLKKLLQEALTELEQGHPVTLAAIAASYGSTPRTLGAVMAVGRKGLLVGTIGGGELEYHCIRNAMAPEKPLMTFSLDNTQAAVLGMVCGGSTQVLFTPISDAALLRRALHCMETMEPGWLLLPLDGTEPMLPREGFFSQYPGQTVHQGKACLSLPLAEPGRIFLLGGGHVSLALSRILDVLEYPYFVVDDRTEFACADRFPNALRSVTSDYGRLEESLTGVLVPGPGDAVCVMTRGHMADADAVRYALGTGAGYIGLMGSRKKRQMIFAQLAAEGFSDVEKRVVTPIGIPLGGQSPAEVAISIAAQLVRFRNQK